MPTQILTPEQVRLSPGISGVDYMIDRPPFTRYRWDGKRMRAMEALPIAAAEGAPVQVGTGATTITVSLTPHETKFTIIALYQANEHGDKMPLGFLFAHLGKRRSQAFTLESDAVMVWWEQTGRYLAQGDVGIPLEKGQLVYPAQLGVPQLVEFR